MDECTIIYDVLMDVYVKCPKLAAMLYYMSLEEECELLLKIFSEIISYCIGN